MRRVGKRQRGPPGQHPARSPVAVEALQLPLHRAADAAAVAAVQPVAHHAQAVMPLLSVEGKVLHLGGNALATLGRRHGSMAKLLPAGDGGGSQPDAHLTQPRRGLVVWGAPVGSLGSGEPLPGHTTFRLLQEGLPITHRETCTPPGETGEAERGTPRKYLAESGGDSNTSSGMELISSWGGGGVRGTKRDGVRSHCPDTAPRSAVQGQEKAGQADTLGGKRKVWVCWLCGGTFLADVLPHPQVLALPKRSSTRQHIPSHQWAFGSQGLLAGNGHSQATGPPSQATLSPCPEGPHPMLALLKNEESNVSAPSTASSSRKLG